MATATKKDRRAKHVTLRAAESLAQSVSYATRDDAEHAARAVRDLAGAARFEPTRQDLTTTSEVVRVAS